MTDDNPYHRPTQDQTAKMGRIGDNDVHAAYVEFRAKESDKVCFGLLFHSIRFTVLLLLYCYFPLIFINTMKPFPFFVSTFKLLSIRPKNKRTKEHQNSEMNNTSSMIQQHTTKMHLTVSKSVSQLNASTASRSARKILLVSVNIYSSVPTTSVP